MRPPPGTLARASVLAAGLFAAAIASASGQPAPLALPPVPAAPDPRGMPPLPALPAPPQPALPTPLPPPGRAPTGGTALYALSEADNALIGELRARAIRMVSAIDARWKEGEAAFSPDRIRRDVEAALAASALPSRGPFFDQIRPRPAIDGSAQSLPPVAAADYVALVADEMAALRQSMAGLHGYWRSQVEAYAANLDFRARALMLSLDGRDAVAERLRAGRPVDLTAAVRQQLRLDLLLIEAQFVAFAAHLAAAERELVPAYAGHWARIADLLARSGSLWSQVRAITIEYRSRYAAVPQEDTEARRAVEQAFGDRVDRILRRMTELQLCAVSMQQSTLARLRQTAGYAGLNTRFLPPSTPGASVPATPTRLSDILPVPLETPACVADLVRDPLPGERPDLLASVPPPPPRVPGSVADLRTVPRDPPAPPVPISEAPGAPPILPPPPEQTEQAVRACRVNAEGLIAYPRVTDPLRPAATVASRHEPAIGGDGVALHDGSFVHDARDLEVAGTGMMFRVARHYRSAIAYERGGLIGQGWSLNLDRRIVPRPERTDDEQFLGLEDIRRPTPLAYLDGTGRAEPHAPSPDPAASGWRSVVNWGRTFRAHLTTYVSPPGAFWEIQRYVLANAADHPFGDHPDIDGERGEALFYVLRDKDGAQQIFNCRGQLILVIDRHNGRISLEYDRTPDPLTQNPILARARDAAGREVAFRKVEIGRAPLATNWQGRPMRVDAAPIRRIAGFTDFAGRAVNFQLAAGRSGTDVQLREVVAVPGGGSRFTTRYGYDAAGRLDALTAPRQVAEGGAPWLENSYDGNGRIVRQQIAGAARRFDWGSGRAVEHLPGGASRTYTLVDTGAGWAASRISVLDRENAAAPWVSSFAFNRFGQLAEATLPRGNRVRYVHAMDNAPVTAGPVRNDGPDVTYRNNLAAGNLLAMVREGGTAGGGAALTQSWLYEPLYNEIAEETDARGRTVIRRIFEYHGYGDRRGRNGNPVRIEIDPVTRPGDAGPLGTMAVRFDYDERGQKVLEVDQVGGVTRYRYDIWGYPSGQERPDGSRMSFLHDVRGNLLERAGPGGRRTIFEYDSRDLLRKRVEDPDGFANRSTFEYDGNRNLVRVEQDWKDDFPASPDAPRLEPARTLVTERTYDLGNREVETREVRAGREDRVTSIRRDGLGRPVEIVGPSPTGSGSVATRIRYDARDLVVAETRAADTPLASTQRYEFDANGGLRAEYGPDGVRRTLRTYDAFDRLIRVTDAMGTETRFRRDANGNPETVEVEGPTGPGDRTAILARTTSRYDELGRLVEQTNWADPGRSLGGAVERWLYDARGLLEAHTRANGATTRYAYDALSRPVRATDALGNTTVNHYDAAGFLVRVEETVPEREPGPAGRGERRTYATEFRRDSLGRVAALVDDSGESLRWYDSLGRLRGERSGAGAKLEFRYDASGRRIFVREADRVARFDWNDTGQMLAARPDQGATERRSYDSLGRLSGVTVDRGGGDVNEQRLRYDPAGRLAAVDEPGGIEHRLIHDALGQTIEQRYLRQGETISSRRFAYDGLGRLVAGEAGLTRFVRRHDGLGNMVSETQTFRGDSYEVAVDMPPDMRQRTLAYPETGGRPLRATWLYDDLGRVSEVRAEGAPVAEYAYVGRDRVQRRSYRNGVTSYWSFGPDRAARAMEVWQAGTRRWTARRETADGRPVGRDAAWLVGQGPRLPASASTVRIAYGDADRVSTTEAIAETAGTAAAGTGGRTVHQSVHDYDPKGRLQATHAATFQDRRLVQATTNRFRYDIRDRIARVETRVADRDGVIALDREPGVAGTAALARSEGLAARWTYTEVQDFTYDDRDRLVRDGRFDYGFDPDGRLTGLHDRWARQQRLPVQDVEFHYDALGRLVAIQHRPTGAGDVRLIYDDTRVIAEIAVGTEAGRFVTRGILAYYLHGARPGEIVRMDRRRDEATEAPFVPWYVHEDPDGRISFLSTEAGSFREVAMEDHPSLTRVPRIDGTATTMPYLGAGSRHLLLPDAGLDEASGRLSYNYRATPDIRFRQEMERFRKRVYDETWDLQAVGSMVMATPLLAAYNGALAAQASLSVGVNWGFAALQGRDYSPSKALLDFGVGGIGGYFAGAAITRLPVSASTAAGLDLAADTVIGTVVDVVAEGDPWLASLAQNALGTAAGRLAIRQVGHLAAKAAPHPTLRRSVDGPPARAPVPETAAPHRGLTDRAGRTTQVLDMDAYAEMARRSGPANLADPDGYDLFRGLTRELRSLARGGDAYLARWARHALHDIDQGVFRFRPLDENLRLEIPAGGANVDNGIAFAPLGWHGSITNAAYNPNTNLIRLNPLIDGHYRATPRDLVAGFLHEFSHAKGANEFEAWYIELRTLYRLNQTQHPNFQYARGFANALQQDGRVPARWGPRLQHFVRDYLGYRHMPGTSPWSWHTAFFTGVTPY